MRALLIPAPALRRLATLIAGAAGLSLLLACSAGAPAAPEHIPMPTPVNRIAYIDSEGQLQTVRPDGSHRNALTPGAVADAGQDTGSGGRVAGILAQPAARNRYYSWPTWSPDGSRIAVSLIAGASAGAAEISVQSLEAATGVGGPVFVNDLPLTIADGRSPLCPVVSRRPAAGHHRRHPRGPDPFHRGRQPGGRGCYAPGATGRAAGRTPVL